MPRGVYPRKKTALKRAAETHHQVLSHMKRSHHTSRPTAFSDVQPPAPTSNGNGRTHASVSSATAQRNREMSQEIAAMQRIIDTLTALSESSCVTVLTYINSRFGHP